MTARLKAQLRPLHDVEEHYRQAGSLVQIDGRQPVEAVTEALLDALEPVAPERS